MLLLQIFSQLSSSEAEMRAKHLRQIIKLASQLVKILKADPEVSETMSTL